MIVDVPINPCQCGRYRRLPLPAQVNNNRGLGDITSTLSDLSTSVSSTLSSVFSGSSWALPAGLIVAFIVWKIFFSKSAKERKAALRKASDTYKQQKVHIKDKYPVL